MDEAVKPKIEEIRDISTYYAKVIIAPLERGYGHTLGNALRRVMLSSVPGFAATEVKIDGTVHEYDRIEGMREDIMDLLLNVRGIAFKLEDTDEAKVELSVKGPGVITAGQISLPAQVSIVNSDHELAHLSEGAELNMEITVRSGKGFVPAVIGSADRKFGIIALDASFSPVRQVSFEVESARVENRTDLDKLILSVETNGVFDVEKVVRYAARLLIEQLTVFAELERGDTEIDRIGKSRSIEVSPVMLTPIEELNLTVRSQNCLKQQNIFWIGDLVQQSEKDLMRFPNLGRKSLVEIKTSLAQIGLQLGTEIPNWNRSAPH